MKIVNTIGGLGNQMFCYAFAFSLKLKHKEDVYVDISHFNHYNLHDGFQINEIFKVKEINVASKKEIKKLARYVPHYALSRIFRKFLPSKSKEYIEKQDYVYDKEALRIIKKMPTWKPGTQMGKPVAVRYTVPIVFRAKQ
jgi:hypothetical protein